MKISIALVLPLICLASVGSFYVGRLSTSPDGEKAKPLSNDAQTATAIMGLPPAQAAGNTSPPPNAIYILGVVDPERRYQLTTDILKNATASELAALLEQLAKVAPSGRKSQLLSKIYEKWGRIAPQAALESIQQLPVAERRSRESDILNGWAGSDPDSLWKWVNENRVESKELQKLVETVLSNENTPAVKRLVEGMPDGRSRATVAMQLSEYLAAYNLEEAIKWTSSQPKGVARDNAMASISRVLAKESPDLAADFAANLSEPADQGRALIDVYQEWGSTGDLTIGQARLMARAPSAGTDIALAAFIAESAARDPSIARQLLDHFSNKESEEKTVDRTAAKLMRVDPTQAVNWILDASSPEKRQARLQQTFSTWTRTDPAAAQNYVSRSQKLSNEERNSILELFKQTRPTG